MSNPTQPFLPGSEPTQEELFEAMKLGIEIRGKYRGLANQYRQASDMAAAKLGGVRGQGLSATAPTLANAIATIYQNYQGNKKMSALEKQLEQLSKQEAEGDIAKLRLKLSADKDESLFQKINPALYTEDSLRKFAESKDYGDLVFREKAEDTGGKVSPVNSENYTLPSLAKYQETGNISDLVRRKTDDRTSTEKTAGSYLERMQGAEGQLSEVLAAYPDFDPSSRWEAIRGVTNTTASTEYQQYKQAASEWIRAKLRKESGAVIGEKEMEDEFRTYFPVPGDSAKVIKQKALARQRAMSALGKEAGLNAEEPVSLNSERSDYERLKAKYR